MSDIKKLPVFDSLGEILSGVTRHYFQLLVVAWPAVIIILAAVLISSWQDYDAGVFSAYVANNGAPDFEAILAAQQKLKTVDAEILSWACQLLLLFASAVAAVRWHRFVLLGEGANGFGGVNVMRKEDGTYIWTTLKIFGVMFLAILAFAIVGTVLAVLKLPPAVYAVLAIPGLVIFFSLYLSLIRLSLALPDAALGQGGRVSDMYKASAGNSWRLLGLALLIGLVIATATIVIAFVVVKLAGALGLSFATSPALLVVGALLYMGVYLYFIMASVTMLSVAYREIIGLPPAPIMPSEPVSSF
ncbi:MAG: hypothetical protein ACOH12_08090 [Parvibaculaceae bacterium]